METVYFILHVIEFLSVVFTLVIAYQSFGDFCDYLEKKNIERCEQWRKEQIEAGMDPEIVDSVLANDINFGTW